MPNALAAESSPYLRQHASNPVDWLPWGTLALSRARELDRPLLLSIGYSSCHWCHVMAHESFEDPQVAALMNEEFVCVKVDREERPDIDALYMEAVQGMTGHGGWPLNVFLTPEQVPFYGGTYFPPQPRHGLPAWTQILQAIAETWRERSQEIRAGAEQISERLSGGAQLSPSEQPITEETLTNALESLEGSFDRDRGGFGGAPKFPQPTVIEFLLRRAAANAARGESPEARMALQTLRAMAAGGIHDQVGGGFHRYAVDATWTVPHFEKMLYDNALLARAYLHGFQISGDTSLRRTCEEILQWTLREMQAPDGGFYSALDADSDGAEGRFYVWSLRELREELAEDADAAIAWFGATANGNFEDPHHPQPGLNVLQGHGAEPAPGQRQRIRGLLLQARSGRTRPGLDDKRLTSWNSLMISALAEAGAGLSRQDFLDAAESCADFVLGKLRANDGTLLRSYSAAGARLPAYLEDHAHLLEALLTLYEASFRERWFLEALALADIMIERFSDPERGGFFSTAADQEQLIVRRKELEDTPIPAGASSAAFALLRLASLTGEPRYEQQALGVLLLVHEIAARHPLSFGHVLQAIDFHLGPVRELALLGDDPGDLKELAGLARSTLRPHLVLAGAGDGAEHSAIPLLHGRSAIGGRPTAYLCESFTCRAPITDPAELAAALR
jgi:uncharacterized protein YyaL (SSP411 family)